MPKIGFKSKSNDFYVYQESISNNSAAIGIDSSDANKFKISVDSVTGVTPSSAINISVDPSINGDIVISSNGTGKFISTSDLHANSISFNNGIDILNQYVEHATWTPSIEFGGGSTGITYTSRSGFYTRIGDVVYVECEITLSSKGTDTGTMLILGFNGPTPAEEFALSQKCENITYGVTNQLDASITSSSQIVVIYQEGAPYNPVTLSDGDIANNSSFKISGIYFI